MGGQLTTLMTHRSYIWMLLQNKCDPDLPDFLEEPAKDCSLCETKVCNRCCEWVLDIRESYEDNKTKLFHLILWHLSDGAKMAVQVVPGFKAADTSLDTIWLIQALQDLITGYDRSTKPQIRAVDDQMKWIMNLTQSENESSDEIVNRVTKEVALYGQHRGDFLWGSHLQKRLDTELNAVVKAYSKSSSGSPMSADDIKVEQANGNGCFPMNQVCIQRKIHILGALIFTQRPSRMSNVSLNTTSRPNHRPFPILFRRWLCSRRRDRLSFSKALMDLFCHISHATNAGARDTNNQPVWLSLIQMVPDSQETLEIHETLKVL